MDEIKLCIGDIVSFCGKNNIGQPMYFPPYGTEGMVVSVDDNPYDNDRMCVLVQWEAGSTSHNDRWWAMPRDLANVTKKGELISEPF